MSHRQNASPDSREGEVSTGVEEEGCVAEALHDEVSIDDDYDEVVAVEEMIKTIKMIKMIKMILLKLAYSALRYPNHSGLYSSLIEG